MDNQEYQLKLMVNKATNRVVYAETTNRVVDFLFSLMEMPIGSIIKLLMKKEKDGTGEGEEKAVAGSFVNIYESLELLNGTYFLQSEIKSSLLNSEATRRPFSPYDNVLVSSFCPHFKIRYRCNLCSSTYYSNFPGAKCPQCCRPSMSRFISSEDYIRVPAERYGYVQGLVNFVIMDDLSVAPISGISTFKFLFKGGVMDVGALEERVVQLGEDEAFKMLRAAWRLSNTVLSDVFLTSQTSDSTVKEEKGDLKVEA